MQTLHINGIREYTLLCYDSRAVSRSWDKNKVWFGSHAQAAVSTILYTLNNSNF
jgi:hypothetical protein